MADQALADVKVLDLTHYIAGPYTTKLLADYGAEVIKIERPGTGDGARALGPFLGDVPDPETSGLFLYLNTNKKSVTLDLRSEAGRAVFFDLVRWADVLVENFSPRVMPGLGLGYETLAAINLRLVMTSLSNFGQTGPYRDYRATEIVTFAMGSPMYSTGDADREPLKYAGNVGLYLAGGTAAAATMAALTGADLQGIGQHVDVSIQEAQAGMTPRLLGLTRALFAGVSSQRTGGGGAIRFCRDGFVSIYGGQATGLDRWWPRFVKMLDMPELLTDPRFATVEARAQNHSEFDAIFLPWMLEHTREEIFHKAQRARVPCAPVYSIDELPGDPQFRQRGYFIELDHPIVGKRVYPGAPFIMSETPRQTGTSAPLLGQHTDEVICGLLGRSAAELAQLRAAGAV